MPGLDVPQLTEIANVSVHICIAHLLGNLMQRRLLTVNDFPHLSNSFVREKFFKTHVRWLDEVAERCWNLRIEKLELQGSRKIG